MKKSWDDLGYCTGICLEGEEEYHEIFSLSADQDVNPKIPE
jgi:hypothetical protein